MNIRSGYTPAFASRTLLTNSAVRFAGQAVPEHVKVAQALVEALFSQGYRQSIWLVQSTVHGARETGVDAGMIAVDSEDQVREMAASLERQGLAERLNSGRDGDSWNHYYELLRFQGQLVVLQHLPRPTY